MAAKSRKQQTNKGQGPPGKQTKNKRGKGAHEYTMESFCSDTYGGVTHNLPFFSL
jgi:hypothetical protein